MLKKEEIVEFIVAHNPKLKKEELLILSITSLVIIKIQIEIETKNKIKK